MNGVDYSASIMVHIIHATFCTCALIRKNEPWRGCSDEETFTDNEGTGKRRKKDKKWPYMLKNLPIIPTGTSQNLSLLFLKYHLLFPNYSALTVSNNSYS